MIPCRSARRRLELRADGRLELGAALELDAHLAECPRCAARARVLARLEELLDASPEPPSARLDIEGSVGRVMARLGPSPAARSIHPRATARRPLVWLTAAGLTLAASLALRALLPDARDSEPLAQLEAPPAAPERIEALPDAHVLAASGPPDSEPARGLDGSPSLPDRARPGDPARELAARTLLRRALIAAGDPALVGAPPAWRAEFDRSLAPLAQALAAEGWPVERLAASWLTHPDPALAGAAARFVGPRADALTLRRLERALGSGADPLAAARALAENGGEGPRRLAHLALHPEQGPLARAALLALEPERAAEQLLAGLRAETAAGGEREREALVRDLARLGPAGARALLAAGDQGLVPTGLALEALASPVGAEAALSALAQNDVGAFVPLAAARLAGARALPRLLELSERRPQLAAPALAWIDDPRAPARVALLAARGDLGAAELEHLAAEITTRQPLALASGARALVEAREHDAIEALLEALASQPSAAALPALGVLLGARDLAPESALAALFALGGSGLEGAAPLLIDRLARCTRSERHLAAACLAGIHALLGEAAVQAWLDELGPRMPTAARRAVLDALRRRAHERDASAALLRLARALEPLLPPPTLARRSEP